jgi:hypothetical protein
MCRELGGCDVRDENVDVLIDEMLARSVGVTSVHESPKHRRIAIIIDAGRAAWTILFPNVH